MQGISGRAHRIGREHAKTGRRDRVTNVDFHAANLVLWSGELEAEAAALPPGDDGVGGEAGLAQDG